MSNMNYTLPRALILTSTMPAYQYHRSGDLEDSDSDMSLPEVNENQGHLETDKGFSYWILPVISAFSWFGL